jgi:predicted transcriptional regulator
MDQASLGEQELALLRLISERGPLTIAQAHGLFSIDQPLARTTVLTMLERLRRKGFLARRAVQGVNHYSARRDPADVVRQIVAQFVQRSLAGSVSPLVAYLNDQHDLTLHEQRELEQLVSSLKKRRKADRS